MHPTLMPSILATNFIQDAFSPLISVFKAILVFLHGNVTGGSWGVAIIGLTIIVRAALVPLTVKQFSSMAKLQALGPDIKALQARYKDDKQRLNEEMMKFYRENQVNPFSSCLPLVLQLPVFLSLFYMLRSDLKLQICGTQLHAHAMQIGQAFSDSYVQKTSCQSVAPGSGKFLFIPDVTASATGVVLVVLIVLYIGSQLISSLMTTATVDRNQRLIALGLPFVFTIFILSFPAGLILYWITTNLWTVGQQFVVRKYFPPPAMAGAGADAGKLSLSGLFARPEPKDAGAAKRPAGPAKRTAAAAKTPPVDAGDGKPTGAARGAAKTRMTAAAKAEAAAKGGVPKAETTKGGRAAADTATTKPPAAAKATQTPSSRGKGRASGVTNGRAPDAEPASKGEKAREAKPTGAARPRGSAPPPPPRKKKKRSGRRR
jgi:YidC/Oxa1 family membrane protein insertase